MCVCVTSTTGCRSVAQESEKKKKNAPANSVSRHNVLMVSNGPLVQVYVLFPPCFLWTTSDWSWISAHARPHHTPRHDLHLRDEKKSGPTRITRRQSLCHSFAPLFSSLPFPPRKCRTLFFCIVWLRGNPNERGGEAGMKRGGWWCGCRDDGREPKKNLEMDLPSCPFDDPLQ